MRCREAVYGFFTQVDSLDVSAGGAIPLNGGSTVGGIWKDGGELTLESEGVYAVSLGASIPENTTLHTAMNVRVNGVRTPGGTLTIDKDSASSALQTGLQTVITVSAGAVVTVTSSEAVSMNASEPGGVIVTLTVVRIA